MSADDDDNYSASDKEAVIIDPEVDDDRQWTVYDDEDSDNQDIFNFFETSVCRALCMRLPVFWVQWQKWHNKQKLENS